MTPELGNQEADVKSSDMTIGQAAVSTGVSKDTLRYYEREGLLPPALKGANGYRYYQEEALRRVRFIKHAQQVGFTLEEVRSLMQLRASPCACCQDVRSVALAKRTELDDKIRIMRAMSAALTELIEICLEDDQTLDACPILGALEKSLALQTGSTNSERAPSA